MKGAGPSLKSMEEEIKAESQKAGVRWDKMLAAVDAVREGVGGREDWMDKVKPSSRRRAGPLVPVDSSGQGSAQDRRGYLDRSRVLLQYISDDVAAIRDILSKGAKGAKGELGKAVKEGRLRKFMRNPKRWFGELGREVWGTVVKQTRTIFLRLSRDRSEAVQPMRCTELESSCKTCSAGWEERPRERETCCWGSGKLGPADVRRVRREDAEALGSPDGMRLGELLRAPVDGRGRHALVGVGKAIRRGLLVRGGSASKGIFKPIVKFFQSPFFKKIAGILLENRKVGHGQDSWQDYSRHKEGAPCRRFTS